MKRISTCFLVALLMGVLTASMAVAQPVAGSDPDNITISGTIRVLDMTMGVVKGERHVTSMVAEITNLDLPEVILHHPPSPNYKGAVNYLKMNAKEINMTLRVPTDQVRPLDSYASNKWGPWKGLIKAKVQIRVLALELITGIEVTPGSSTSTTCTQYLPVITDIRATEAPVNPHQPTNPALPSRDNANITGFTGNHEAQICAQNCRRIDGAVEMYNLDHETPMTVLDLDVLVQEGYLTHWPACYHGGTYSIMVHPTAGSWIVCSYHNNIQY